LASAAEIKRCLPGGAMKGTLMAFKSANGTAHTKNKLAARAAELAQHVEL
jgi:hypothetical protein